MQAIELTENSTKIRQKRTKTVQKQDLHTIQINESTCEYKNTVQKKNNVENYPGKAIFVSLRASSPGATVPPEAPGDFLAG